MFDLLLLFFFISCMNIYIYTAAVTVSNLHDTGERGKVNNHSQQLVLPLFDWNRACLIRC